MISGNGKTSELDRRVGAMYMQVVKIVFRAGTKRDAGHVWDVAVSFGEGDGLCVSSALQPCTNVQLLEIRA